jgi:transposase
MRRTNNDFFRQLEELTLENERLKRENKSLRGYSTETLELRQKLVKLESSVDERIAKAIEGAVAKATAPLLRKIDEQQNVVYNGATKRRLYTSDWGIDLKTIPVYTEYRRPVGAMPKISYGNNLMALAVYLSVVGLVAVKRLSDFFRELTYGMATVSKATLAKFTRNAAGRVNLSTQVQDLLNGDIIHVDETPIKTTERPNDEGGTETSRHSTFNAYIRTYSNGRTTVLTANPRKTEESVVKDNILTRFHGIVSQDHEAKFYKFGNRHATCGAHLSRELKGMAELGLLDWANESRVFYVGMNNHKNKDMREGANKCNPGLLDQFERQYDKLVEKGRILLSTMELKAFGSDELMRMTNRLAKHKDSYMLFIREYAAPFTNNQAERDLRHCKAKQKISGCFRSWQGILDYCNLRSLLDTAKKRGENLMDSLGSLISQPLPAGQ